MNGESIVWIDIGALSDIPPSGARCVEIDDRTIAVFRDRDDRVYALEDKCPHSQGPLSQGIVHDGCVTCPLHNWVISLASGKAQGADSGSTQTFRVEAKDGRLLLEAGAFS